MKFVVLASARLAEPRQLLEGQRREYLQALRDLNALLEANGKGPVAELLVEGAILHLKADLEWLELIEQRLALKEERAPRTASGSRWGRGLVAVVLMLSVVSGAVAVRRAFEIADGAPLG